jgi:hypothetical protein
MDSAVPRTSRPFSVAAAAGLVALVLGGAACSSSSSSKSPASTGTSRPPLSTAVPVLPDHLPKTAGALARLMAKGLIATGSAHITVDATGRAVAVRGTGGLTMVNGAITGLDMTADIGNLRGVRVIEVNSVTYGRLPKPARADKPWSPIPGTGGPSRIAKVRTATATTEQLAAPGNVLALVTAGRVKLKGAGKIGASAALRYAVTTRVSALPRSAPIRIALTREGVQSMHLDLWIDGAGRPLTVKDTPTGDGATSGTVRFRAYNDPVALQAPSATTVARG